MTVEPAPTVPLTELSTRPIIDNSWKKKCENEMIHFYKIKKKMCLIVKSPQLSLLPTPKVMILHIL